MAFQTGTSTDLADLIADFLTFATANGWTQDENDTVNGHVGFHRNSVFVQFRYDVATPQELSIYQSLGWISAATDPGSHTDDSGNGYNGPSAWSNALADDERHVADIEDGPFTRWFFEADTYLHVVILISPGVYRHFGFGQIVKTGDWTGGEYCYGQNNVGAGLRTDETVLLDGGLTASGSSRQAATIHMEGLPGQDVASEWGQIWGTASARPDDTAAHVKAMVQGGCRGGPTGLDFGNLGGLPTTSGFLGPYPIELYYMDLVANDVFYLGHQPAVRVVNMEFFAPGDTIVVGSDTWYIFPASQKALSGGNSSNNLGIAYRRDDS